MRFTILFLCFAIVAVSGAAPTSEPPVSLAKLPLFYEQNAGQFPPQVRYFSRGQNFSLALTDSAAVLALARGGTIGLEWEGASAAATWSSQWQTGGTSSYFRGEDSSNWHTAVPHYARIRSANLYRGVDLVFYGSRNRLEFDFIVAPNADPGAIRIRIRGAKKVKLEPSGELVLHSGSGSMRLAAPTLYQPSDAGARPVSGGFQLKGDLLTFSVGSYDRTLPLVIDPTLTATYFGGSGTDIISDVATDPAGNIFVTGYTTSPNFPVSNANYKGAITAGDADAFVVKLNPDMTQVIYATYLGGSFADYGRAIAVDATGAAYITGSTVGRFPVSSNPFRPQSAASPAIFVTKLNPEGTLLAYSTYLDGAGAGQGIAVDSAGSAYVTGWTYTATFTTTPGAYQRIYMGNTDAFVVKMNSTGSDQVYSTFLGGSEEDQARDIAINGAGEAFLTGFTSSSNFPTSSGSVFRPNYSGATDAFVVRLNASGNDMIYATYLGASGIDRAYTIAIDSANNAYLAGETFSTSFPVTSGALQQTLSGSSDAFVVKMNASGTGPLTYATFLGGAGACSFTYVVQTARCDAAYSIAVNTAGQAYVAGVAGSGFPLASASQASPGGSGDAFLAQLSAGGNSLVYSTYLGGALGDAALAVALRDTTVVVGGVTSSSDVPLTTGSLYPSARGGSHDGLLARFGDCPATFLSTGSNFPAAGGTFGPADVTAASTCTWAITNPNGWITINRTTGTGPGPGQFTLTLAANTGCQRIGYLTLPGGSLFQVVQSQDLCARFAMSQSWFPGAGGTFGIYIIANKPWTVTSTANWITVVPPASGSSDGFVSFTVAPNPGAYRYSYLQLDFGNVFRVDQSAGAGSVTCTYSVAPVQETAPAEGVSGSFLVASQEGCGWTATTAAPWVTLTSSSGSGEGVVGYEIGRNTTGQGRVATISVGGQTFTITQAAP
ncbi:MAG: SBBP repeat-containing protein [Bryobacterales bacterium]|nr:SBBP repeat-containing protein [Bryobacterales bacterium]